MNANAIVPNPQNSNNSSSTLPAEWQMLQQQAAALVASGFLPQAVNTPQKAVAIMLLGKELGIAPWAALTSINVIQQKPTVSPQLMLALINRSGQLEDMTVQDDGSECAVVMKRVGRTPHSAVFSMSDAQAMGLSGKDNWKKQPAIMRQWRAVAACARVVFADVILGLYTPEEMGAEVIADEQGNMTIVDVKPEPIRQQAPQEQLPPPQASRPATVSGAGVPKAPPQARQEPPVASTEPEPPPLNFDDEFPPIGVVPVPASEEDPNLYHCDTLVVNRTKTATQYILKVQRSATRIPITPDEHLAMGDVKVIDLKPGEYPLMPTWSVYADSLPTGGWEVTEIKTGMGELEGV